MEDLASGAGGAVGLARDFEEEFQISDASLSQ
jgi:hypothetical protein